MQFIQDRPDDPTHLRDNLPSARVPEDNPFNAIAEGIANSAFGDYFLWFSWVGAALSFLWSIYAFLAYIASIIMLGIYVYATVRWNQYLQILDDSLREQERLYDEHFRGTAKNSRLEQVYAHSSSENPNDWKLAIIEADIILDDTLKQKGYAGNSLGERLRSITPSQLQSIDDAWEAHKVRNNIAHQGSDFVLTRRLAEETINRYRRVFTEFGIS